MGKKTFQRYKHFYLIHISEENMTESKLTVVSYFRIHVLYFLQVNAKPRITFCCTGFIVVT